MGSAASAWGGMMFHKRIADGKKLILECGMRSLASRPQVEFWVKMCFLSGFGFKQTTYKLVQLGDLCETTFLTLSVLNI